jgi:hypothetical protein
LELGPECREIDLRVRTVLYLSCDCAREAAGRGLTSGRGTSKGLKTFSNKQAANNGQTSSTGQEQVHTGSNAEGWRELRGRAETECFPKGQLTRRGLPPPSLSGAQNVPTPECHGREGTGGGAKRYCVSNVMSTHWTAVCFVLFCFVLFCLDCCVDCLEKFKPTDVGNMENLTRPTPQQPPHRMVPYPYPLR